MTPTLPVAPAPAPSAATTCPMFINGRVRIPAGVTDLASFQRWLESAVFPKVGRFSWLDGLLWVDLSMERVYSHNDVKDEVTAVLRPLVSASRGEYYTDGMHLRNSAVGMDTVPDGFFCLFTSLQSARAREVPGRQGEPVAFEGTPDMVLEVVSDNSVEKDTITLPARYRAAGIPEFWRIDARGTLTFELLRWTATGYHATPLSDGWQHSDVFGRDFRLVQGTNPRGRPRHTLEVR